MKKEQDRIKEDDKETDELFKKMLGGVLIAAFIAALRIFIPFKVREEALEDKNTKYYLIGLLIMVIVMHFYLNEVL